MIDVSSCHCCCSMNQGSLDCARAAGYQKPVLSRASSLLACWNSCRDSICCGVCVCLVQLADVVLQCFTLTFPSACWAKMSDWGCLKYSQLLWGQGCTRNQNVSPRHNVNDCCMLYPAMQPRKMICSFVLLDISPQLWLEPVAWEHRGKRNQDLVGYNSYHSPLDPGTWLCISLSCLILEKALAKSPVFQWKSLPSSSLASTPLDSCVV